MNKQSTHKQTQNNTIVSWNCQSITSKEKRSSMQLFLDQHRPLGIIIVDHRQNSTTKLKFHGYKCFRHENNEHLAILIREGISCNHLTTHSINSTSGFTTTWITIQHSKQQRLFIGAIYRWPGSMLESEWTKLEDNIRQIQQLMQNDQQIQRQSMIMLGDFNCHGNTWSDRNTSDGDKLLHIQHTFNLACLNSIYQHGIVTHNRGGVFGSVFH